MLIDIHFHADFLNEIKLLEIQRNRRIKFVITNSVDLKSCKKNLELSRRYPKIKLAAGLYPEENISLADYEAFEKWVLKNRNLIIAIGEIGLDLYHTDKNFEEQKKVFLKQLELAKKINVPAIVHSRDAEEQTIKILEKVGYKKIVLHCFSGNFKLVQRAVDAGFYFSIPTNIVRSEHFQKMVAEVPRDKILTETDAPYLSPYPEKKNEPSFINESINKISKVWDTSKMEVERRIEENFNKLVKE